MHKKRKHRNCGRNFKIKSTTTINASAPIEAVPETDIKDVEDKKWDMTQGSVDSKYPDTIRFTAYAFAKMLYLREKGSTEISGFALTDENDPYLIIDFLLPKQECTGVTTEMTSEGIVELFDKLSGPAKFNGLGLSPSRYGRIWIHTHPGFSSEPSGTDWSTFKGTFGDKEWSIMFVFSSEREATCMLQIQALPDAHFRIPWEISWEHPFAGTNYAEWDKEYDDKVTTHSYTYSPGSYSNYSRGNYSNKWGPCEECGDKDVYLYTVRGKKTCWKCKDKMPADDPKYAKWNELMVKEEDDGKKRCKVCSQVRFYLNDDGLCVDCIPEKPFKDHENVSGFNFIKAEGEGGFMGSDDPEKCDMCGKKSNELTDYDGKWACEKCSAKLEAALDKEFAEWEDEEEDENTDVDEVKPVSSSSGDWPEDPLWPPRPFGMF
jgi:hypothetical protein